MELRPSKKTYSKETQRTVSPEETLLRVEKLLPEAGITRVADITSLDRIGIPVFSSIRPTALNGAISVYNGKGATPVEAKVSAMMEGIERFSAEPSDRELVNAPFPGLPGGMPGVDPSDLILPEGADPGIVIPWVEGFDIAGGGQVLVPANAVFHPLPRFTPALFRTNTNGLASGNTLEEATFHALMELIERDAWSLAEVMRNTGSRLTNINDGLPAELLSRFSRAGVEVIVKDITSDIGIPTIAAVSDDITLKDPTLLTIGMGTHTNAEIALLRAITEVAQSRLTQIHGAREDTNVADFRRKMGYERTKRMNRYWFESEGEKDFKTVQSCDSDDFRKDIERVVSALAVAGLDRVIVVDLTRPNIGVPVVRVIVPGLEVYAMDQERKGRRCIAAGNRRVSRPKSFGS
ncbi:MAG TPA: YcaO-related McrA-glycine thioamidation protein [Methanoregulaceae archaeon]|nr:YcaO-related McrA-glycine thioamidation protein [Methanoregulaceae archaeon]